jgi:signal transduction histidine kinase
MNLRLKLAAAIAAGVVVATAATAVVFATARFRSVRAEEQRARRLVVDDMARTADEAQLARDPLMVLDAARRLVGKKVILYARVHAAGAWQQVGTPPAESSDAVVEMASDAAGKPAVELGFSRREVEQRLEDKRRELFHTGTKAGALMALLGLLAAYPLSAGMTRRILRIEAALAEIGEGKSGTRLPDLGGDELGKLAAEVNGMAERLEEVEKLKRTFVASVTHELRTPLGVMEGYLEQLQRRGGLSEADRADLARIQANARRLSHFVTNLLDLAKIERGRLDFAPRAADPSELVESSVRFFEPKAKEAGIALALELQPGIPSARLDPDLYTHVLTNLLSNALKYTPRGGTVAVALRRSDGRLLLSVSDSGVGIKGEDLKRLFTPFERVANPLKAGGVGLGLAISKHIAALHQGDITVDSQPGRGSRFTFAVPV